LDAALGFASQYGLESLSIGSLAELTKMSKSGVFSHFGSREELQLSVIREYHHRFEQDVFFPAMFKPRGICRLTALFENWVRRTSIEIDSGCIYISGAAEFDDRPGPVRDALMESVNTWMRALKRAIEQACEERHLVESLDASQIAFEIHGLVLALHYEARFLHSPNAIKRAHLGYNNLLQRYGANLPKP